MLGFDSEEKSDMPGYAHISSHPGYNVNRSQELLQQHGQNALTILLMVKYGFANENLIIPSLDTFRVLEAPGCSTSP